MMYSNRFFKISLFLIALFRATYALPASFEYEFQETYPDKSFVKEHERASYLKNIDLASEGIASGDTAQVEHALKHLYAFRNMPSVKALYELACHREDSQEEQVEVTPVDQPAKSSKALAFIKNHKGKIAAVALLGATVIWAAMKGQGGESVTWAEVPAPSGASPSGEATHLGLSSGQSIQILPYVDPDTVERQASFSEGVNRALLNSNGGGDAQSKSKVSTVTDQYRQPSPSALGSTPTPAHVADSTDEGQRPTESKEFKDQIAILAKSNRYLKRRRFPNNWSNSSGADGFDSDNTAVSSVARLATNNRSPFDYARPGPRILLRPGVAPGSSRLGAALRYGRGTANPVAPTSQTTTGSQTALWLSRGTRLLRRLPK